MTSELGIAVHWIAQRDHAGVDAFLATITVAETSYSQISGTYSAARAQAVGLAHILERYERGEASRMELLHLASAHELAERWAHACTAPNEVGTDPYVPVALD